MPLATVVTLTALALLPHPSERYFIFNVVVKCQVLQWCVNVMINLRRVEEEEGIAEVGGRCRRWAVDWLCLVTRRGCLEHCLTGTHWEPACGVMGGGGGSVSLCDVMGGGGCLTV